MTTGKAAPAAAQVHTEACFPVFPLGFLGPTPRAGERRRQLALLPSLAPAEEPFPPSSSVFLLPLSIPFSVFLTRSSSWPWRCPSCPHEQPRRTPASDLAGAPRHGRSLASGSHHRRLLQLQLRRHGTSPRLLDPPPPVTSSSACCRRKELHSPWPSLRSGPKPDRASTSLLRAQQSSESLRV